MRGRIWRTGSGACGIGFNLNPASRADFANGVSRFAQKADAVGNLEFTHQALAGILPPLRRHPKEDGASRTPFRRTLRSVRGTDPTRQARSPSRS